MKIEKIYIIFNKNNEVVKTNRNRWIFRNLAPIKNSVIFNNKNYKNENLRYEDCIIKEFELKETGKIIDMNKLIKNLIDF